ncbi:MAG: ATP-binding protein [Cycloclasticus sp.]|nr:ATP-binding protein [Cycloclasticus sp.]MBG97114.1 ATP-binding protein [Cycloclasticus sp.]|tara:strand:- start:26 stop:529 length:504 start_codon:yes stop_codon:yes gene_type:complete
MPKRFIKKYYPDHKKIKEIKCLKVFGPLIHNQNVWHLNRRSFAGAISVGLFIAFIPLPAQMLIAAAAAIALHVNLPVAVATVWVSNPITMPPLFYAAYRVGASLMEIPASAEGIDFSFTMLLDTLGASWKPFLLGCFVLGSSLSAIGYVLARGIWRWFIIRKWLARQ